MKRILAFLMIMAVALSACGKKSEVENSNSTENSSVETSVVEDDNKDKETEKTEEQILPIIEQYEFLGSGKNFDNPYDADDENLLTFCLYSIVNSGEGKNYYSDNGKSGDEFKEGYVIPKKYADEVLEVTFGIVNANLYSNQYYFDNDFYFFPSRERGYIVEHKIRSLEMLPNGKLKAVVDSFYPEETALSGETKEYIFKKEKVDFDPVYLRGLKKGDEIYTIRAVRDFDEGKLKEGAVKFNNPFSFTAYKYKADFLAEEGERTEYFLPQEYKSVNGFYEYEVLEKIVSYDSQGRINMVLEPDLESMIINYLSDHRIYEEWEADYIANDLKSVYQTYTFNIKSLKEITLLCQGNESLREMLYSKLTCDENGKIDLGQLKLPAVTKEELLAVSNKIEPQFCDIDEKSYYYFCQKDNEEEKQIIDFLSLTLGGALNIPTFDDESEIPLSFMNMVGLYSIEDVQWYNGGETENTHMEMKVFSSVCDDWEGYIKGHVEAAVKEIFGEKVEFKPFCDKFSKWKYHDYCELFTPPHMMTGGKVPVLFSVKEKNGYTVANCGFLYHGYELMDNDSNYLEEDKAFQYAQNNVTHYNIYLKKGGAFGYRIDKIELDR